MLIGYEDIFIIFVDDLIVSYCFFCEMMEYLEDLSWVIFNLCDDVIFLDGKGWSVEDLKFIFDFFME